MQIKNFPFCCTVKVICDLGGTTTSEGSFDTKDPEEIEEFIHKVLTSFDAKNRGFYVVTTNNQQTTVNNVLRKLKFSHTPWEKKAQHPNTKIRMWWINPIKYKKKLDIQKDNNG